MTAEGGIHNQRNNILSHSMTQCGHGLLACLFFDSGTVETTGCLCVSRKLSALPY